MRGTIGLIRPKFVFISCLLGLAACGGPNTPPANPGVARGLDVGRLENSATHVVALNEETELRFEKNNILEVAVTIPTGSKIQFPQDYEVQHLNYRKADGTVDWSSTGFIQSVQIVSAGAMSASEIASLNQTAGGLFVFDSIVGEIQGLTGNFPAMTPSALGDGFLKNYHANGQPLNSFAKPLQKRFGRNLNRVVDPSSQSEAEKVKWHAILSELKSAVDRTVDSPKSVLMIDPKLAVNESIDFEKTGAIPPNGAWTIATQGTAKRHGFENVPCAEFQSELLREAYQRAGYRVTDDFNSTRGNPLIWSSTASVLGFSTALNAAGWVPWDASAYRPLTGAIMMDGTARTPGHAYAAAGHDGRFIVDNGSPQGRDLGKTVLKTINMMYQTGVFFLPPGIIPARW